MAAIDDIKNKVDGIESALSNISGSLGGFIGNKGFDDGIKKLESILTNNYKKSTAKNGNLAGSTTGGKSLGNTVGEMLGVLKNINKHIGNGSINQGIENLNNNTSEAVRLLTLIEQHVGNTPSNSSSPSNQNSTGSTPINSIDKNVNDIKNDIKSIAKSLLQNATFSTEDDDLNKLIKENLRKSEELKKERLDDEEKVKDAKERKDKKFFKDRRKKKALEAELDKPGILEQKYGFGAKNIIGNIFNKDILGPFTSLVKEKPDASKTIDNIVSKLPGIWGGVAQVVKGLFDLGAKQDKATTEFARAIGGFNRGKYLVGETVGNMISGASYKRGYTADAAYSAITEIAESRGRTTERLSAGAIESAIDLKRFGFGGDVVNNFDTFGKSIEETDRYFAKLYSEVSKKGLSFKNVSKAVNDNLKAAQSHTFANGLRGLEKMAERSTQLKYNMQQVFQFADKVSEVEGAINTAANLSVLGGSFAQYANPMQLLYEGLNDTEALQKRIESMFGNKVFWNQEKGQMDMSALGREMVKQAAKATGLNPDEMLNMSYNEGKMRRVENQLGQGLSKETTDYIKNIAELDKNGKAFVTLNGEVKYVSKLTENDKVALEKESSEKNKADNAKLGDIYQNTMSITDKMDNLLVYLQEKLGRWVYKIAFSWMFSKDLRSEAQGEGSDYDKKLRGALFDAYSGTDQKGYSKRLREAGTRQLESWAELKGISVPQAANGFSPTISANSGILKGSSHFNGGIKGLKNGIPWEAEGGEYLINKNSSLKYRNELNKIQNGTFNPYSYSNELIKNNMGKYFNSLKVAPIQQNTAASANVPNLPNAINGRIKIDIPQTITINLAGGEKIGDYDIKNIVMAYVDKFMKEATMRANFSGFDKETFYNKSDII